MTSTLLFFRRMYGLLALIGMLSFAVSCNTDDSLGGPVPVENEPDERPEVGDDQRLPWISVNTLGDNIVDEPKTEATISIVETGSESYNGTIGIEFRGASSQSFPKKSYGVETWDGNRVDIDVSLLGYPEEEDWIIYGPFSDKSLVRNKLIYDLARYMGRYASRTRFVELDINDSYRGVYVFMEKLKRSEGRIEIDELEEDDNSGDALTGGYILKIDKLAGDNLGNNYNDRNSFTSKFSPPASRSGQRIHFLYEEPAAEDITDAQKRYIADYVGGFEAALDSDNFTDASLGYSAFIDTDSFIDFFLLNEISNNVDGFRLSTYMHKDRNGKLVMGPIWDFNLAFGNANYCNGGETNVWAHRFNERCPDDSWQVPFWWGRFLEDPAYVARLKERWGELRASIFSEAALREQIDGYVSVLDDAGAREQNFLAWPILGSYVWPNNFVGDTYADETGYLKDWITDRLAWMDSQVEGL